MINLPNYQELEPLHTGRRTLVYRALRLSDRQKVIIKTLRNPQPSFNELAQFRNQYTMIKGIDSPFIVQPLALERYGNGYALIMPYQGMIGLANYWQQMDLPNGTLRDRSLNSFLKIAIQLAQSLQILGQNYIIHKDIKPANILIHPTTEQVQLIDFSISSLLPKEQQQLINPNGLEGTLAYISPEQTGRMNRGIDYRTDFYSLGVTFYQLLTEQLPFQTSDVIELVHSHIAKTPLLPHQIKNTIPPILSDIILKLMAKNAEDRYQSALGLKHDLERCQQQLQSGGIIVNFPLGERDLSDRFLIPEKLYGRENEVKILLEAFERVAQGQTELMLVAGFSGIGKTAVVNEVHKPITRQKGYFLKGKFDQFNRNIPLSAVVQAFRDLMEQFLSESDQELQSWRDKILTLVGENGHVLIEVIPELEKIIGSQPVAPQLTGSAAQNRFNLLFQKFVRTLATPTHPLVIFLDDLQWADNASLQLIQVLLNDPESRYLLLLGAYRDNEVNPAHPLIQTLGKMNKSGLAVQTITLAPLNPQDINQLIADTLKCSQELAQPLSELVYQKAQGNPFFSNQFLKFLQSENLIRFEPNLGYWQCDLAGISALTLSDNVVEFMTLQLQKLPEETKKAMQIAACIGNEFNLETLALVCEEDPLEIMSQLWAALQQGFILPTSQIYKFVQHEEIEEISHQGDIAVTYRFLHDRVQQAAYALIATNKKSATHLKIGEFLLNKIPLEQQETKLFTIVNQLNEGRDSLKKKSRHIPLAELNLRAGKKAKNSTAYAAALNYFKTGLKLLTNKPWQHQYDLTLALTVGAAESAYLQSDFEEMDKWAKAVLKQGKSLLDKVSIYKLKIWAFTAQGQLLKSVEIALEILAALGVNIPPETTPDEIQNLMSTTQALCDSKSLEELLNLPLMKDAEKQAALEILGIAIPPTSMAAPHLFPWIVCQQVILSIEYGNSPFSAFAYAIYGMMLCQQPNIELGYQFGQLALALQERFQTKELQFKVEGTVHAFIHFGKHHAKESLAIFLQLYRQGLENGDLEFSAYATAWYCLDSFLTGNHLPELEQEISIYSDFGRQIKNEQMVVKNEMLHQTVINLMGGAEPSHYLKGEVYNVETMIPLHQQAGDVEGMGWAYIYQLMLGTLFEEFPFAVENANLAQSYLDFLLPYLLVPIFHFYSALARLAVYPTATESEQESLLQQVENHQQKMQYWAHHAPMNFQHKYDLIEAEKSRVFGLKQQAIANYDKAIAGAKENGYLQEEALANELAAKFYLAEGQERTATSYLLEAYYGYARWGAKAKTDALEQRYPQLLEPILASPQLKLNTQETIADPVQTSRATTRSSSSSSSNSSTSELLDVASILKACYAISSELQQEQLIAKLTTILMENAGATKCALILPGDSEWRVAALTTLQHQEQQESFPKQSLETSADVPISLIRYVRNTSEILVFDNINEAERWREDAYIKTQKPKSVLCLPILKNEQLGILYLENNQAMGVFTQCHQEILKLLTAQVSISLENANLYQKLEEYSRHLEQKVEQKTHTLNQKAQDLEQALKKLQQTQAQLIHSEKMSSLGQLVAGIAHEINNPASFIMGNINHLNDGVTDLIDLLTLYQQEYPQPSANIQNKSENIDLDFLLKDLRSILESMRTGSDRIRQIVNSLRNFSRLDESEVKSVDIHTGLDSTLLILQHRLKADLENGYSEINITKEYGQLPLIKCYASALNQVFMNLLNNAIDALRQAEKESTDWHKQPTIVIETLIDDRQHLVIRIADNGLGIEELILSKIFDPFFTTKPVGSGTGLGLSISYSIIVEKHQGQLICHSTPGQGAEFLIKIPV